MQLRKILISGICLILCSCAAQTRTVTRAQPVSLSHAKGGIIDAKDFLSRAKASNDEMGAIIKKLQGEGK